MKHLWKAIACSWLLFIGSSNAAPLNLSQTPLFLTDAVPPLTMLVLSRDHKLYFEAYNDISDIDGDGQIDLKFKPGVDYYGYFDSYKCYAYSSANLYFYPVSKTATKQCPGNWSGNFLNYVTTARLDAIRKVLYGGYRAIDLQNQTILQRTYVPQDGHSWGKEYQSTAVDNYDISQYAPFAAPSSSNYLLFANTTLRNGTGAPLLRVAPDQPYPIRDWVSIEKPVAGSRADDGSTGPEITGIQDFVVRVKVCDPAVGLESNCRVYPNGDYKPIGLLQEFGENESMYFGLITGSYVNNLAGGVLRKNIDSITDEIDLDTGQFTSLNGIIATLNKLTVTGFQTDYNYDCGWITTRNINNGECQMWGNPVGEMMYEAVRYFAGKGAATSSYNYSSGTDDSLGLPKPGWQDPYTSHPRCAKANMLVLSDLYPSYDSDQVPGSYFMGFSGDISGLNVSQLAQTIFSGEGFSSILAFIGQSGSIADGAPTPKTVSSFGNIRGLAPNEPNSEGSYYSAAVSYFAWINDIHSVRDEQNVKSYIVALSSPLPEFNFTVGDNIIKLIPFGKSVGPAEDIDPAEGRYQPTNSIVDVYIETLTPTSASFWVYFEDVQQGGDFDMDAVVKYTVTVQPDNTLDVELNLDSAGTNIIQHMGYVISGTTQDGVYLEVKNLIGDANDVDYFLDTPPGQWPPGQTWDDDVALPPNSTTSSALRTFSPGPSTATILKSPLWYAAKWGGFNDLNNNDLPDQNDEWDTSNSGDPDNYFLVTTAVNLSTQLAKVFEDIIDRTGSFSSAALSSGFLAANTRIYQAIFRTKDWSGQLLAFAIDPITGDILTNGSGPSGSIWDASVILKNQDYNTGRRILTHKPSTGIGIPFRWPTDETAPGLNELDLSQILALNTHPATATVDNLGQARLNYLRGNTALQEKNGGTFRDRPTPLGDIINSSPIAVGAPQQAYPVVWIDGAPENNSPYSVFKQNNLNRNSVIYVGANDGMLHAFDAITGSELFAYVPSTVFSNLAKLTSSNYTHQYYADGSPTVIDVFINSQWRTILAAGLNGGGQAVYALDITDPNQFSESAAESIVKWEFTDADDVDLGFTYGQPSIVRLANGKWAAIFGNGYNNTQTDGNASTTGNSVIYIVDIETKAIIKKFNTGVGMSADPLALGRPNGMSTPVVLDVDGNSIADIIYAGDLFGNVWKMDISSANVNNWDFSFKQGSAPAPLFVARDASGNRQPITTRPAISTLSYTQSAYQIYVGTGKYLESADKTDLSVQTVYALRDDNTGVITGRSELLEQTIIAETEEGRVTSNNLLANNERGWYMDLIFNNVARGERVNSNMIFINDKIIFATIIPTSDPCDFGGESWLMELNALTGSRLNYHVFDINNDGNFDNADSGTYVSNGTSVSAPVSGLKSKVGLIATPSILNAGDKEFKYLPGTSGNIQKVTENPGNQIFGRQSWRQMK